MSYTTFSGDGWWLKKILDTLFLTLRTYETTPATVALHRANISSMIILSRRRLFVKQRFRDRKRANTIATLRDDKLRFSKPDPSAPLAETFF